MRSHALQAKQEEWQRQAAEQEFARRQAAADAALLAWQARQQELRGAIPTQLWERAQAAWGSELLPWEIGAFGQLVCLNPRPVCGVSLACSAFLLLRFHSTSWLCGWVFVCCLPHQVPATALLCAASNIAPSCT